ncbi:LIC12192 family sporadic carbohydrate cluster protein [Nitrospirillum iridis]|uniref:Sporadic carbohydrate cluster protein (TIGR04323 family) n=1 Tax=Nitrospirillum iridis TaxID=765888 RepID=A0A7X0ED20_9PROT|nr:LIC12192 family sporadic carbohydrate cluster protein [Nitrospirillum iridis]MBB6252283.1 sporadic carbohydrate cluster protein (TIGR04323 family) [Nitrospirillum iridis]
MAATPTRFGHRGYISPRPVRGSRVPQHVQNLVIRDYCARQGLSFRLSVVEYIMDGCYLQLQQALDELPQLHGVVAYTLFMLPQRRDRRLAVYDTVLERGGTLHFAVEGLVLATRDDIEHLEDIWGVQRALDFRGAIALSLLPAS